MVMSPQSKANPAELVGALGACHVHTATALFDIHEALWARLRVANDPLLNFQFFGLDLRPFDQHTAGNGFV